MTPRVLSQNAAGHSFNDMYHGLSASLRPVRRDERSAQNMREVWGLILPRAINHAQLLGFRTMVETSRGANGLLSGTPLGVGPYHRHGYHTPFNQGVPSKHLRVTQTPPRNRWPLRSFPSSPTWSADASSVGMYVTPADDCASPGSATDSRPAICVAITPPEPSRCPLVPSPARRGPVTMQLRRGHHSARTR